MIARVVSKYETLSNFVLSKYPDAMVPNWTPWERNGGLLISPGRCRTLTTLVLAVLSLRYSQVTFESWQRPSLASRLGVVARMLRPHASYKAK